MPFWKDRSAQLYRKILVVGKLVTYDLYNLVLKFLLPCATSQHLLSAPCLPLLKEGILTEHPPSALRCSSDEIPSGTPPLSIAGSSPVYRSCYS